MPVNKASAASEEQSNAPDSSIKEGSVKAVARNFTEIAQECLKERNYLPAGGAPVP